MPILFGHKIMRRYRALSFVGIWAGLLVVSSQVSAQSAKFIGPIQRSDVIKAQRTGKLVPRPFTILVDYKRNTTLATIDGIERANGIYEDKSIRSTFFKRYFMSQAAQLRGQTLDSTIAQLRRNPNIRIAEPDMPVSPDQVNDPQYSSQWHLNNTGQTGGTPGADVRAAVAWPLIGSASPITVAVLDDGIEVAHSDLNANILLNTGEIAGDGIDNDGNGYVDDVNGWDFADGDNDPTPPSTSSSHGTHVAGIVAAVSNNSVGIASAARNVKILPVRFYRGQSTWISDLILAIDYARIRGAKVVNISYNLDGWTQLLVDAFNRLATADGVAMLSAGNNGQQDPPRLAMLSLAPNLCFVACTDHNDNLSSFSNYGSQVQIAAPGENILSTIPYGTYGSMSGTSMATPLAAGIVGTVRSLFPSLTYSQAITRLGLTSDKKASLTGRVKYGRVNLANAIQNDSIAPSAVSNLTVLRRSSGTFLAQFTSSGDDGMTGAASAYDVRVSPSAITAGNFSSARQVSFDTATPGAGNPVKVSIGGLIPGQAYYIAVKAQDKVGNESPITTIGPVSVLPGVAYENMEGGSSPFTPTGTWALTTAAANSGSQSWTDSPGGNYANGANSTLTYNNSITVSSPMSAGFMMKYDLESGYDFLSFEVSTDSGATWTALATATGSSGSVFKSFSVPLVAYVGQTIKVRFHMTSDSSVVADGVYIDDFFLKALTTTFSDNVEGTANFSGSGSTWVVSTESASSPTRAWNDGPGVAYANNTNQMLKGITNIDAEASGSPAVTFKGLINTEAGFDFLNVITSADGGTNWVSRGGFSGLFTTFSSYYVPMNMIGTARIGFQLTSDSSVTGNGAAVDDIAVVGEPWVQQISGTVGLNGYTGTRTFNIKLLSGSTVVETDPVSMTGTTGTFTFQTSQYGTFDIAIEGPGFLRRVLSGVNVTAFTTISTSLINGDIDGNNLIGTGDFNALRNAWGATPTSTNWNAAADLNGDGIVGIADFNILRSNWGAIGD